MIGAKAPSTALLLLQHVFGVGFMPFAPGALRQAPSAASAFFIGIQPRSGDRN
jgi:hypothetical protein